LKIDYILDTYVDSSHQRVASVSLPL